MLTITIDDKSSGVLVVLLDVITTCLSTTEPRCKRFKHLPNAIRVSQFLPPQPPHDESKLISTLHQAMLFEGLHTLTNDALRKAKLMNYCVGATSFRNSENTSPEGLSGRVACHSRNSLSIP